ncbi:MAG TPA: hypothetical protein VHT04_15950 [Stellaceae bacterium]|jgi:hypothetical protein|nr:hypothetical protein [Stellaceae bacterium]
MSRHRYPTAALAGDYARAGAGLALTVAPLVLLQLNAVVAAIFAALAALFAVFAGRTLLRQRAVIEMNETAIESSGPFAVRLAWDALDELKLGYYATRRDGGGGWMQLALRAGGRRLLLDSRIEGFAAIATRAAAAARRRELTLNTATANNLASLGIAAAPAEG